MSTEEADLTGGLIDMYRSMIGPKVPHGKQIWSLCGPQAKRGSELSELVESKLITPRQYHGVNKDSAITLQNSKTWAASSFYTHRSWVNAILKCKKFDPGMVIYNATKYGYGKHELYHNIVFAMHQSPFGTLFCVKIRQDPDVFLKGLVEKLTRSEWSSWTADAHSVEYKQASGAAAHMYVFPMLDPDATRPGMGRREAHKAQKAHKAHVTTEDT